MPASRPTSRRRRRGRPSEDPGTDALQGAPRRARAARAGAAGARARRAAEPEPVAEAPAPPAPEPPTEPLPEPEPAASQAPPAYEYDPNATVMPEALRERKPEPKAKPKKERKPREPKAAKPKPVKPDAGGKPAREGEKPTSKAFPIAVAAGAVIALLLGFMIGGSGGGGGENAADTGALTGSAASSGAAVKIPGGWSELGTAPDVPGLSLSDPKAAAPGGKDGGTAIVVGTVDKAADNSTLLAQPFLQAIGSVPKPSGAVQIGGGDVQAYRYDNLKPNGFDRAVTVYTAPTSAGVATLACLAPAADAESFGATCDQIANTLELSSGDPFPVGPSKDYAATVEQDARPPSARRTRRARPSSRRPRRRRRRRRRRARWPRRSMRPARRCAAQDLSPADRGVNGLLVKALRQTGGGYDKAASAAAKKNKSAFNKAGDDVAKGRKAVATRSPA